MKLLLPKQIMDRLMEECKSVNTTPQAIIIELLNIKYNITIRQYENQNDKAEQNAQRDRRYTPIHKK